MSRRLSAYHRDYAQHDLRDRSAPADWIAEIIALSVSAGIAVYVFWWAL